MITQEVLKTVVRAWGIELGRTRPDIPIAGSPERCAFRVVVEDEDGGRLYILERFSPDFLPHKRQIARTLSHLRQSGLATVHPYCSRQGDETVARLPQGDWQLGPFIEGVELIRPDYADETWRGRALADFLTSLKTHAGNLPDFVDAQPFSLVAFILDLIARLQRHDPDVFARVSEVWAYLQNNWVGEHDNLPVYFCHGDYHPLNIIWGDRGIVAVIDWEFLGVKREPYDAANLIGCVGMEHPKYLTGGLVTEFIHRLKQTKFLCRESWSCFYDFVLAQRFSWLSEWLHKSDDEMVDLECVYIRLLHDQRDRLRKAWNL
jgi:homoserine kinase type II